jgi:hypothetical protein
LRDELEGVPAGLIYSFWVIGLPENIADAEVYPSELLTFTGQWGKQTGIDVWATGQRRWVIRGTWRLVARSAAGAESALGVAAAGSGIASDVRQ